MDRQVPLYNSGRLQLFELPSNHNSGAQRAAQNDFPNKLENFLSVLVHGPQANEYSHQNSRMMAFLIKPQGTHRPQPKHEE